MVLDDTQIKKFKLPQYVILLKMRVSTEKFLHLQKEPCTHSSLKLTCLNLERH